MDKFFEHKIVNIFLSNSFNIYVLGSVRSKEPSQWDGSFEYLNNMIWFKNKKKLRNKKNNF